MISTTTLPQETASVPVHSMGHVLVSHMPTPLAMLIDTSISPSLSTHLILLRSNNEI